MASPLQDISATSVDIQEEPLGFGGNEHLIVTVTRVDDLLDDNGDFLAERVMAVRVNFDVVENQVCLHYEMAQKKNVIILIMFY
jgi:sulfur carrier protein ThiS